jgi:hypothetical protein
MASPFSRQIHRTAHIQARLECALLKANRLDVPGRPAALHSRGAAIDKLVDEVIGTTDCNRVVSAPVASRLTAAARLCQLGAFQRGRVAWCFTRAFASVIVKGLGKQCRAALSVSELLAVQDFGGASNNSVRAFTEARSKGKKRFPFSIRIISIRWLIGATDD